MKKLFFNALSIGFFSLSCLPAQATTELSGIYQELILGVDPGRGVVTGYYREVFEPPNLPHLECSFYLSGKMDGGNYAIQAWSPRDKKPRVTSGELSFFSEGNNRPSALLRLDKLDRDCASLKPNLAKGQGVFFDLKKNGAWSEVRVVATPKSPYYQAPDPSSPARDSAKRGTVVTVMERRPGWARVESEQKPKGWIREADLHPTTPSEGMAEPTPPVPDTVTAPSKISVTPAAPAKQGDMGAPPRPEPTQEMELKGDLSARLKTLNAQAFEMALQVLENPALRSSLAPKRIAMEHDFNRVVSRLQQVAPSAYPRESGEIFETFLDLQYVKEAQPVVSLRLNQRIQTRGN